MNEDPHDERFNSISDFYGKKVGRESDPLQDALHSWDLDEYQPLRERDIELYLLICNQLGFELDILLGAGCVKLQHNHRHIVLTWNGDDEDLLDLVLEGASLVSGGDA
ncbi:MAG: hypothetical protein WD602_05210 [Actinomycetota bacterium]